MRQSHLEYIKHQWKEYEDKPKKKVIRCYELFDGEVIRGYAELTKYLYSKGLVKTKYELGKKQMFKDLQTLRNMIDVDNLYSEEFDKLTVIIKRWGL